MKAVSGIGTDVWGGACLEPQTNKLANDARWGPLCPWQQTCNKDVAQRIDAIFFEALLFLAPHGS